MKLRSLSCAIFALALAVWAAPVGAQSAAEVVQQMLAEYERRAEGVDDYTVVQDVMGFRTVSYYVKEMVDGRPVFRMRSGSAGGADVPESVGDLDQIYAMGDELAQRATYRGVERVNDYDLHVLEIDDFRGMGLEQEMSDDAEFRPTRGKLFVDVDTYAPRRFEFEGEMTNDDGVHQVTSTVTMGDYREIDGLLLPFRTVVEVVGLGAAIDPEMRAQFEQMQRELENMPESQRAMVEQMMAGQLEQFRAMMEDDGAPMTVQVMVEEVRVNQGPPGR
jgi:hypothetical protein